MPKIIITDVQIVEREVVVPDHCPNCRADLTAHSSLSEERLSGTLAYSHVENGESDAQTDSEDTDINCFGTTLTKCTECSHVLGKGTFVVHKDNPNAEHICQYLDVSTANLTPSEANFEHDTQDIIYTEHDHGAFVHVWMDDEHDDAIAARGYPNLVAVMKVARELDCRWINFDADAEALDGLPTFDW